MESLTIFLGEPGFALHPNGLKNTGLCTKRLEPNKFQCLFSLLFIMMAALSPFSSTM